MTGSAVGQKVVCVRLDGRLGNHMFQYAAGLSVARAVGAQLTVDPGHGNGIVKTIAPFGIDMPEVLLAPPTILSSLLSRFGRSATMVEMVAPFRQELAIVKQPFFHYWEGLHSIRSSCYLVGYWASHLYFEPVADEVRAAFDLQRFASPRMAPILSEIAAHPSVGVHVRRGDYTEPQERLVRGLCERPYYDRAANLMRRLLPSPRFFVFSDDIAMAREELGHWPDAVFVEGFNGHEDMFLLSRCKHTIVANSTFSWWAAWLNPNAEKIVIAPRWWFSRKKMMERYVLDLIPNEWILL